MKAQTVSIIGVTRATISVALALKASPAGLAVIAHDRNRDRTEEAQTKTGAFSKVEWNLVNAASAADIIVLDVPMVELENTLTVIGGDVQAHTLVLDFGTLKGPGLKWARQHLTQGHYVGASPILSAAFLADGRDDPGAASADLFRNGLFALMPSPTAEPAAVETAVNFGRLLGAVPYFVDPMEYDALAQGVETLPGLLAAAMFGAVQASPSWRDILRFANNQFGTATQALNQGVDIVPLALNDKASTLRWLDALIAELGKWRSAVSRGETDMLELMAGDMVLKREKWLKERAENNWVEMPGQDVHSPSFSEQLLGGWISGRTKKDSKDK